MISSRLQPVGSVGLTSVESPVPDSAPGAVGCREISSGYDAGDQRLRIRDVKPDQWLSADRQSGAEFLRQIGNCRVGSPVVINGNGAAIVESEAGLAEESPVLADG